MSQTMNTTDSSDEPTQALVPKLRFPEFREAGEWEQQTLQQVSTALIDGDWIESKDQSDSGYRLIQTGNIGIGEFIAKSGKERFVSLATFERLRCTEIFPGDCLVSRLPDPAGRSCVVPDIGVKMITAVDCMIVRLDKSKIVPSLYISRSQTDSYFREVATLTSGSTRQRISRDNLSTLRLTLPPSLPEQARIADCLSSLDELLAAQARKVEALKTHKKGLMEQLFPREGETQPRLRFPEFRDAGEWITMPLGNAATFYNGRAYKQEELLESGKYTVLRVGNFFTNNSWYHSDLELDETKYCDTGDLLYAWSASFGPRIWGGAKVIYHYHIWKVVEHRDILRRFLFIVLENETEQMKANSANGLGLLHITKGTIEAWQASFPPPAEQARIADCLSSLDDLIAAEAHTHEALKTHKKGLMQQLFPTPAED